MKINRIFSTSLFIFLCISSLGGCKLIARNADNIPIPRIPRNSIPDEIPIPNSGTIREGAETIGKNIDFELVTEIAYKCAEESAMGLVGSTIENAIDRGYTQISTNYLLNLSNQAIQECTVIKLGLGIQELGQSFTDLTADYSYTLVGASSEAYGQNILFVE